jgi:alpha-glucosidase
MLTLRGTPFLYAGEELGLEDAVVPPERVVDPGGRDGCRAPLPWTDEAPNHGWINPWLPLPANAQTHSAEAETGVPGSMHSLYRRLLETRRSSPVLQTGSFAWLDAPAGVLAYRRALGSTTLDVYVNFTDDTIDLGTGKRVVLSSVSSPHVMLLAPNEARIVS